MVKYTGNMRPSIGKTHIQIPISWEVKRQVKKNYIATFTIMIIIAVVLLLYSIGIFFLTGGFISKIFKIGIPWIIFEYVYRFPVFREGIISRQYEEMKTDDYKIKTADWWGIYSIDTSYPYIAHYRNGLKGVFLKVKKDVVMGKGEEVEFDHYQQIMESYAQACDNKIHINYIDYMNNVGNDERMEALNENSNNCKNEALSDFLSSIYNNLDEIMQQEYSSYDVYLLYTRDNEEHLAKSVALFLEQIKNANYKSITPMKRDEIQLLAKQVYNLDNFSVLKAEQEVVATNKMNIIRPLKLVYKDGSTKKLNNTFEEEKQKREARKKATSYKIKENKDKSKSTKHTKQTAPKKLVDMFDTASSNISSSTKTQMVDIPKDIQKDQNKIPHRGKVEEYQVKKQEKQPDKSVNIFENTGVSKKSKEDSLNIFEEDKGNKENKSKNNKVDNKKTRHLDMF